MRVRKASTLLLLLTPSLVHSASEDTKNLLRKIDAQVEGLEQRQPSEPPIHGAATTTRSSQATSKPYRGTEDAPVDGLDGKPHAGPFVDSSRDGDGAARDGDGVMNDEYRIAPKKGTTGTEGGISEKDKLRSEQGYAENKPYEPKEAPPLPHSEQDLIEENLDRVYDKSSRSSDEVRRKSSSDYTGGLEHPGDLPDRPYDLPYPEPSQQRREGEPEDGWLKPTMPFTEKEREESIFKRLFSSFLITNDDGSWHEWFHSFVLSLTMILFSEIGDKTFLIAALMAMRHNQILVFSAAFGALIVMTVLSAVLGHAVPTLLPKRFTTFAAAMLFLVFGAKMLREGLAMPKDSGVGEEMREVEAELEEKEHSMAMDRSRRRSSLSPYTLESARGRTHSHSIHHKIPNGRLEPSPPLSRSPSPSPSPSRAKGLKGRMSGLMNLCSLVLSPAWVQTFVMTFLGEWGDRSQIATIAMAAGQDYWWVTLGAITGHACCTGLAVIGGRALAGRVSMRVVTIGGALAFLVFGVIYLFECMFE